MSSRDPVRPSAAVACITAATWVGCSLLTPFDDYREPPIDSGGSEAGNDVDSAPIPVCPPGQKSCSGGCVPANLPEYGCASDSCTRCSVPFAQTVICTPEGKCAAGTCQGGRASCDGNLENGCEADLSTAATCGNCTTACGGITPLCTPAGQCVATCPSPLEKCGTSCVDVQTSAKHCKTCDNACPSAPNSVPKCVAGACTVQCNVGYQDCVPSLAGCEELKPYFRDLDSDGVGAGNPVGEACTAPGGHSLVAGDCNDNDNRVKPGQTTYFTVGYTNASGKTSYDFDCNGVEQLTPSLAAVDCAVSCSLGAFVSASRSNPPPGVNYFCGSTAIVTYCSIASCSSSASTSAAGCR